MDADTRIKLVIGQLVVQAESLQAKLAEKEARIQELEAKLASRDEA